MQLNGVLNKVLQERVSSAKPAPAESFNVLN